MMQNTNDYDVVGNQTGTTPPGFNKNRRDTVKWLLMFVDIMLFSGEPFLASIVSAFAIISLKDGTFFSTKNLKWMMLSIISFVSSLTAWIMRNGSDIVDEEKAYTLKILLWLGAKSIQAFWAIVLALFLVSAFASKEVIT